jgi:hypothetical protein
MECGMRVRAGKGTPTITSLLGVVLFAAAIPVSGQTLHVPSVACTIALYPPFDPPRAPRSLEDLSDDARMKLDAYLSDRLGAEYASKLRLVGGQVLDKAELAAKDPEYANYARRLPKYNLHFHFPIRGYPRAFCVSVTLDDDGTVVEPLTLPNLRAFPERGQVIGASEAIAVAALNGVPVNRAERSLHYFPDTDTLEYVLSFVVDDDGLIISHSHFHVVGNDPSRTHWTQSEGIR